MLHKPASLLVSLLLLVSGLAALGASPATAAPDNFSPRPGITFNNPVGDAAAQRAIFRKVMRSIDSTKRGSDIKIFSWNFLTSEGATALLNAQKRGVRVRIIMDRQNDTKIVNQPWRRLRSGLVAGNKGRPDDRTSWARTCGRSCRGKSGASHTKMYLFSEVGKAKKVVIQGSANFTVAATTNQWNDVLTYRGNDAIWRFASHIFDQASKDRAVSRPYASKKLTGSELIMFPLQGKGSVDPVARLLNQVTCRGAQNTASGRTRIRILPDVIREDRGMKLARLVRGLWNDGCDVRIGYTVMGIDVGRYLRGSGGRGPVPMRHMVQDTNGDGIFDNYFHLKAMSVVGNVRGDRSGYAVLNGSANWSTASARSDENVGVYYRKGYTLRYQEHIDYWYDRFGGASARLAAPSSSTAASDSDAELVFGSGANAVHADGTPVSTDGTDPFATRPAD